MAGEVFIARQDTLETVKGTVDGIDSGVKQTNNALGNFSGGGTDTVKTELQTLKDNMAQLQTKSDQLQSLVEQLMNKGGGSFNFDNAKLYCMEMEDTNFRTLFTTRAKIFVNGIVNVKTKNVNGRVYINGQEFLYYRSSNTYPLPENAPLLITDTNGVTIICENANSSFWVEN